MGNPVFFEEGGDHVECLSEVFAALVSPEVDQSSASLILDEWEPFSEDLENS